MSNIQRLGNLGCYIDDNNAITFQIGSTPYARMEDDTDEFLGVKNEAVAMQWLNINGYNAYCRGTDNRQCERIEKDIKRNRLLPRLISKQVNMLYGRGPKIYKETLKEGKPAKEWTEEPLIQEWLESWENNGMEMKYTDFGLAIIKRYYLFQDFFVKWRMSYGVDNN